jgi:CRP-like cAMP-binding protein
MERSSNSLKSQLTGSDHSLAKFRVFADLNEEEIHALIDHSASAIYKTGEKIISEGDEGHSMFVILRGRVRVMAEDLEIATLGEGDFFGEIALVDDGLRSADVFALEDCELLVITVMTLGVLAAVQPGAAIHLLAAIGRSLVRKLRADNARFRELILLAHEG